MRPKQERIGPGEKNEEVIRRRRRQAVTCLLHLRLAGGLIEVARAMRVLKRYSISQSRVSLAREGSLEVATVKGTLADSSRSRGLATALSRIPGVLEAVVSRGDEYLAAFHAASSKKPSPRRARKAAHGHV
jgi:hypothetical protein